MNIEKFVSKSIGEWDSMRSGHSLAFKQFENIRSKIRISSIEADSSEVSTLISETGIDKSISTPFSISWEATSDWEVNETNESSSGFSLLIPIPISSTEGQIIRSLGYAEKTKAISKYKFLSDGTFTLSTVYENTIAEERIWFLSENVRCRTSLLRTANSLGILQASYSSEIRRIKT